METRTLTRNYMVTHATSRPDTVPCPTCQGRGWVVEPIRVYYQGEWRDEAAITIDCVDCYATGRVPRGEVR